MSMSPANVATLLNPAAARLLDLIVPRLCHACGNSLLVHEKDLYENCTLDLSGQVAAPYCGHCGKERQPYLLRDGGCSDCRTGQSSISFHTFIRVGRYAGVLQALLLRFKHDFVLDALLGKLLADAVEGRMNPTQIDYWVPVPSHWKRRWSRGFHLTRLLSDRAVHRWRGRVMAALIMTRHVPAFHHGMSIARRTEAIRGAFRVAHAKRIAGRHICLIDDVSTTGATLAEAGRTLREAGVASVSAAVLGKTANTRDPLGTVMPI